MNKFSRRPLQSKAALVGSVKFAHNHTGAIMRTRKQETTQMQNAFMRALVK